MTTTKNQARYRLPPAFFFLVPPFDFPTSPPDDLRFPAEPPFLSFFFFFAALPVIETDVGTASFAPGFNAA
jgi:hypothetical protein